MLQKTVEISVLYDFYNQMLTEKQRDIVDLYYNQDLSLGEIADEFNISRQAVYDMLKRTERLLYQYEEKLGFIKLLQTKNEKILTILDKVIDLENGLELSSSSEQLQKQINEIKYELDSFLNN
ncbi:putative DNA-binding protein [Alkaliphilus sp. MSJ-5]|uniref:UPF0122 protein KQI88_13310 n=1 Tax=Alkaliphilus flagellatus TaxID=2841507 RepID=A0ABS6G4H8_9FIRM|nr:putative DNA-binding protein [Alkaliphilus flagellatus]MBU5677394.1 putative DNA-binding protein [Alkaliphilus flagellatus]